MCLVKDLPHFCPSESGYVVSTAAANKYLIFDIDI
jgi:hypothetical protein